MIKSFMTKSLPCIVITKLYLIIMPKRFLVLCMLNELSIDSNLPLLSNMKSKKEKRIIDVLSRVHTLLHILKIKIDWI